MLVSNAADTHGSFSLYPSKKQYIHYLKIKEKDWYVTRERKRDSEKERKYQIEKRWALFLYLIKD